jgi:hypothetical protein
MIRFLGLVVFFTVATGVVTHFGLEIPWVSSWIGQLPGDLIIKKDGVLIYLPIASSVLISVVCSIFKSSK